MREAHQNRLPTMRPNRTDWNRRGTNRLASLLTVKTNEPEKLKHDGDKYLQARRTYRIVICDWRVTLARVRPTGERAYLRPY